MASLSSAGDSVAGRPPLPRPPKPSIRPRDLDRPEQGKQEKITCQDPLVCLSHSPLSNAFYCPQLIACLTITAPNSHEYTVFCQWLSKQVNFWAEFIRTRVGTESQRISSIYGRNLQIGCVKYSQSKPLLSLLRSLSLHLMMGRKIQFYTYAKLHK